MPLSASTGRENLFSPAGVFPQISSRTAGDILRKAIPPVGLTDTLLDALRWMEKNKCFTLPVVQSVEVTRPRQVLKGILDCRTIFRVIGYHFSRPAAACREIFQKPLFQIMQPVSGAITPHSPLGDAMDYMIRRKRDLVPVIGDGGFLGVITIGDILDEFIGRKLICNAFFEMDNLKLSLKQMYLQELERRPPHASQWLPLMLTPPVRFRQDQILNKAIAEFRKEDRYLLPVYDATEHWIGTLSRLDMVRALLRISGQDTAEACQKGYHTMTLDQGIGDTCGIISIRDTVHDAAEQIRMNNLCGLSVLSEEQFLCGFITPCSLLPALAGGCLLVSFFNEKESLQINRQTEAGQ